MKSIREADFKDKKVLLRVDFNAPMKNGKVLDDFRIKMIIPTIKYILQDCEKLIMMSHAGRPKGKVIPEMSLKPVTYVLEELLGQEVAFADDYDNLPDSRIILLENLRFNPGEEANDEEFAKKLASMGDLYINDAFAICHRAHASVVSVPKFLPSYAGFHLEKELEFLSLDNPEHPVVAIVGGAKLETKLPVITNMVHRTDNILVGGAMIFNFYKMRGWETGKSLLDPDYFSHAKELDKNDKIIIPSDVVIAEHPNVEKGETVKADQIPKEEMGLDIGEESLKEFKEILRRAKTIVWNGPLGYYENPAFAKATEEIAKFIAELPATTIIGGGDTASIVRRLGLMDEFTHVSTGGGASLILLEGKELYGVKALY